MTIEQLIEILKELPLNMEVGLISQGDTMMYYSSLLEKKKLVRNGVVYLTDIYDNEDFIDALAYVSKNDGWVE